MSDNLQADYLLSSVIKTNKNIKNHKTINKRNPKPKPNKKYVDDISTT